MNRWMWSGLTSIATNVHPFFSTCFPKELLKVFGYIIFKNIASVFMTKNNVVVSAKY